MRVKIHGSQEESGHPAHTHVHMKLEDIQKIIRDLHVSDRVKTSVMDIYQIIAQAEFQAHNCTVEEVHFTKWASWMPLRTSRRPAPRHFAGSRAGHG